LYFTLTGSLMQQPNKERIILDRSLDFLYPSIIVIPSCCHQQSNRDFLEDLWQGFSISATWEGSRGDLEPSRTFIIQSN